MLQRSMGPCWTSGPGHEEVRCACDARPAYATQAHPEAQIPNPRARMGQIANAYPQ